MKLLALDIGGANLKAADGRGFALSRSFPLWQSPERLADGLRGILTASPACDTVVATMTGELCDCFATKADGVRAIVQSLVEAAGERAVLIYGIDGSFVSPREAISQPQRFAASNWHALASFAAQEFVSDDCGLLVDIGSTTSDIIPLVAGCAMAQGRNDPERLASGELVYTGVERSPLCGVVRELPWRDVRCGVAQELFATTRDVYLTLGELPDEPDDRRTADGRPATREFARDRLARAICADRDLFSAQDAHRAAKEVRHAQLDLLGAVLQRVVKSMPDAPSRVIISGHGEFLAQQLAEQVLSGATIVSLNDTLDPNVSRAAAAHALACLARAARPRATRHSRESTSELSADVRIIKLGGSLLDLPDLADRLSSWLSRQPAAENRLLVGGGPLVDALQAADRIHRLDATLIHRLCIEAMAINGRWVADLFAGPRDLFTLIDAVAWHDAEDPATALPASWDVTSDSIAARIAADTGASEIVLLKSTLPPTRDMTSAVERGYVDPCFATAVGGERDEPRVRCVDLRSDGFPEIELVRSLATAECL